MASNDVYNVYKRNGTFANKGNSSQTKSIAKNKSEKSKFDDNIINPCQTQQGSSVLEDVFLLSNDDLSNENTQSKYDSRKHVESCAENKQKATHPEIVMLNNNNVSGQDAKCAITNLEATSDDCKDNKCSIVNNILDVVAQNLLGVAIIKNVSMNAESKNLMSDENEHDFKCNIECNQSKSILPLIENNVHNCSKEKSELEQEMELYEASERNDEAQLVNCDSHDLVREESIIAIEPQNKKKRALEGCFYERKRKKNKCDQILVTKTKNDEDVCFICFDGGDLVLCDHRLCPKAYHLNCIGRDKAFFSKKGAWFCGSHFCLNCKKTGNYQCYTCPTSFCKQCVNTFEFHIQDKRKGLCEECLPIVNMIEQNKTINNEGEQVDFEDKETYEYLFKDYWIELKKNLSIVISNIDFSKIELKNCDDCHPIMQNHFQNEESDVGSNEASSSSHASFKNSPRIEGNQNNDVLKEMSKTNPNKEVLNNESIYKNKNLEKGHRSPNNGSNQDKNICDKETSSTIEGWASRELMIFLENMKEDVSKPLTRFAVHKLLWMYIKKHKLQNPKQVSDIICDKQLRLIFEKESIGQFEMFKLLNKHFPTKDSNHSKKTIITIDKQKVEDNLTSNAISQDKIKHGVSKLKRKAQKHDEFSQRPKSNEYAAINYKNISLIYLKRSILEEFVVDSNFDSKVVGTFVKIRVPGNSKMDSCYRLVLVIGTSVQKESYMVGSAMTNATLLILNLQKKESITIDVVSNQDFTEEECKRLRLNIKCGFLKTFTVGQLEEKAISLQEAKINDWMENERQRLINLRDRASEKGQKKELRECVEKLQELNNPAFRIEKVEARPRIFADSHMDPTYESDDGSDYGEGNTQLATNQFQTLSSHSTRQSWESNIMEDYKSKHSSSKVLPSSQNEEINKGVLDLRPIETTSCQTTSKSSIAMHCNTQNKEAKPHRSDDKEKPLSHDNHDSNIEFQKRAFDPRSYKDQGTTKLVVYKKDAKIPIGTSSTISASNYSNNYKLMHVSLVPTELVKLNNSVEHEKLWHYVDPSGTTQGPFSMEQLRKWNGTGLFPIDLRVWKTTEEQNQSILLINGLQGKFNIKHDHVCQVVEGTDDKYQTSISTTPLNSRHHEIQIFQENNHIMNNDQGLETLKPCVLTQSSQAIHDMYVANHIRTPPYDNMSQSIENLHKTFVEINTMEGYNNIADENQSLKGQIDPKMPCKFHIQGHCWKGKTCGYWHT